MITKKELLAKYRPYPTYTQIAIEAFEAGLKIGREEVKTEKTRQMEKDLEELRNYHKNMESILYDPEKLADLIYGI
tara:strand:- start:90 stop:317 length:228 start_codon:yes stop_codon:yes gene_type:complete